LDGKNDLSDSSSLFCVYNAGKSTLPQKLLKAKASRVVVLEPAKSIYLNNWKKFAKQPDYVGKTVLKPYDFNRLGAGRSRDYHNNKGVDSLCQLFSRAGAAKVQDPNDWWGKENASRNEPPIRIVGVADPYKEHALFTTLLYCRITRSSIYESGPAELLCAVSPQQYVDLHPKSADDDPANIRRSKVPKLVRWRARLYRYLFDINLVTEAPFDSFSPEISSKDRLKYERDGASTTLYDQLKIDREKMYWISIRPRNCDELETLVSRDYTDQNDSEIEGGVDIERRRQFPHLAGFVFMHKILMRHPAKYTIGAFLNSHFYKSDDDENTRSMTIGDGSKAARIDDLVLLYKKLATEGGARFYNSPFFVEAQEFVDSILCPAGTEPTKRRDKMLH